MELKKSTCSDSTLVEDTVPFQGTGTLPSGVLAAIAEGICIRIASFVGESDPPVTACVIWATSIAVSIAGPCYGYLDPLSAFGTGRCF
jgi:hypothetical protein